MTGAGRNDEPELEPAPDEDIGEFAFVANDGTRDTFPQSRADAHLSEWLASKLRGAVRFNHSTDEWHAWNGLRWAPDKVKNVQETVYTLAEQTIMRAAVARQLSGKRKENALKALGALLDRSKCESALDVLSTATAYKTDGSDWDQQPYLLGVANGVLDLRTGTLDKHPSPKTLVTKTTGVRYDPEAKSKVFVPFLHEITSGDPELARFFVIWFGYSLFGYNEEQRFLILTGLGRNGKGALAHAMRHVFGEYTADAHQNLYMKNRFGSARSSDARSDLMKLKGMRLAIMSEPDGGQFNEEMLKAHTGGDPIVARPLYGSDISWLPTHTITFLTNRPPSTDDIGPSMAARVMVADFRERYEGEKEDKRLYDKLVSTEEAEGILKLLVDGAQAWWQSRGQENGNGLEAFIPQRVKDASREYLTQNDPIGRAVSEAFIIDRKVSATGRELYDAYVDWHRQSGEPDDPMSQTAFGGALTARGFVKKHSERGVVYAYIRPKSAMELADAEDV